MLKKILVLGAMLGAVLTVGASAAFAHPVIVPPPQARPMPSRDWNDHHESEWRELREARARFYSRPHSRREVRRFERWYAERMDTLRNHSRGRG
jgi:hypothetical protein